MLLPIIGMLFMGWIGYAVPRKKVPPKVLAAMIALPGIPPL